ncbi:MAG: hypothetical protein HGA85_06435 [Nanoarchaeota archaeon]|nr:hypothetical protein [Nanoarchaeota archaeon]
MAKSEMKKASKAAIKVKKKQWFPLFSPKSMGEKPIGESFLEDPQTAIGRTVQVNLMQLTGDVKNQSADMKFEIVDYKEGKLETKVIGYSFSTATIKRYIRRHMTRIDDSLVVKTLDGVKTRIKPFILTRSKVTRTVEYTVRATAKQEIIAFVNKTNYEDMFNLVIRYSMQKELKDKLSKIYPVKNVEIKFFGEEKDPSALETPLPAKKIVRKVKDKKQEEGEESEEKKPQSQETEEASEEPDTEKDSEQ